MRPLGLEHGVPGMSDVKSRRPPGAGALGWPLPSVRDAALTQVGGGLTLAAGGGWAAAWA